MPDIIDDSRAKPSRLGEQLQNEEVDTPFRLCLRLVVLWSPLQNQRGLVRFRSKLEPASWINREVMPVSKWLLGC